MKRSVSVALAVFLIVPVAVMGAEKPAETTDKNPELLKKLDRVYKAASRAGFVLSATDNIEAELRWRLALDNKPESLSFLKQYYKQTCSTEKGICIEQDGHRVKLGLKSLDTEKRRVELAIKPVAPVVHTLLQHADREGDVRYELDGEVLNVSFTIDQPKTGQDSDTGTDS